MAVVTTRQLLESGVHFGHQTRRWNPKMKRFIFTERNGIYIIDLQQSLTYIDRAYAFVKDTVARGGQVLFVGTKKQAQEAISEQATRVGMPYVNQRWLGGMLTNFHTVIKRIQRLKELEGMDFEDVAASGLTKKELLGLRREKDKLEKTLGGIRDMIRTPQAVWIVDTKKEHLAVDEARKLKIPVIGILDTNCDPDEVDFAIPGNDDAIRSVSLLTRVLADAVAEGLLARSGGQASTEGAESGAEVEPMPDWERELLGAAEEPARGRCRRGARCGRCRGACCRRCRGARCGRCRRRACGRRCPGAGRRAPRARRRAGRGRGRCPAGRRASDARRSPEQLTRDRRKEARTPMGNITAADVKKLRDATGAGMMDCKKALTEADGDHDKAVEILRVSGQAKAAKRGAERSATNGLVAFTDGALLQLGAETDFVAKNTEFQALAADAVKAVAASKAETVEEANAAPLPSGQTVAEAVEQLAVKIGEKLEVSAAAYFDGQTVVYLHKRAADLPPQVGVLVEYEGADETAARAAAMQIAAMRPQYLNRDDVPAEVVENERRIAEATAKEENKPEQAWPRIVEGRVNAFFKDVALLDQLSVSDNKTPVGKVLDAAGIKVKRFVRFEAGV